MAKFRTNHTHQGGSNSQSTLLRIMGFVGLLLFGLYYLRDYLQAETASVDNLLTEMDTQGKAYLPTSTTGQVIHHIHYSLSYSEKDEQAEWVSYVLTRDQLDGHRVERNNRFEEDPRVKTGSATYYDYRGSGYDKGHLVPAADRGFSKEAMTETFLLSNISPQVHTFNGGIWRELEEHTRDWARKCKKMYIVTGPVLPQGAIETIGKAQVTVPKSYYKILLDVEEPEQKAIAFVMPNEKSTLPIHRYATTIDKVEEMTGINFFPNLLTEKVEAQLESSIDTSLWKWDVKRYRQRLTNWNNN